MGIGRRSVNRNSLCRRILFFILSFRETFSWLKCSQFWKSHLIDLSVHSGSLLSLGTADSSDTREARAETPWSGAPSKIVWSFRPVFLDRGLNSSLFHGLQTG